MKKLLLITLIIGTLLFSACGAKKPATTAVPLPIDISATQLIKEYKNNAGAADKKYKDKELSVSGVVKEIGKETSGTPFLLLTGSSANETTGVYCTFFDNYDSILAKLHIGQDVGITGICKGFNTNVLLDTRY